jgi:hypothetical protein
MSLPLKSLENTTLGVKTPPTIRKEVIIGWLNGLTRDEIANNNHIGAGTVSAIIKECREVDPDFDLIREVAVNLRRNSLNVGDFASTIRLRTKMIEWGLIDDTQIEDFIEKVNIYCFRAEISPGNFVDMVHKVISIANLLRTPVDKLPPKILKEQKKLGSYQNRVKLIGKLTEELLSQYQATRDDLADYKNSKPILIDENRRLKTENEILKQESSALRKKNSEQYMELYEYRYDEMISEHELKKLDLKWLPHEGRMSVMELYEIAHEIYHNPCRYIDIIRQIRENRAHKVAA